MMLARTFAATPWGIEARPVSVEADRFQAVPGIRLVGLPDAAVKESRERVRTAIRNTGFRTPALAIVVNLAPADLRKEGNHLDLAIAIALLVVYDHLPPALGHGRLFCGELGLDGTLRPIRGGLALAEAAVAAGVDELVVPAENAGEAASLGGVRVVGASTLLEVIEHLLGRTPLPGAVAPPFGPGGHEEGPDLSEVRGQETARRALEIAAAGGHNLLLIGPPGSGKTMLARRLPSILPPLSRDEAIEVTKIHSLAGDRRVDGLVERRPFRSPHAHTSTAGLIGGGRIPRPGEVSLAHRGVLFLDELPEFRRDSLEALRQPLEDGEVSVVRTRARFTFPARFTLVAAMNPCPCGHLGDPRLSCRCPEPLVSRYRGRISGPLLDRIDLHVEVPAPSLGALKGGPTESSRFVRRRVEAARARQRARFGPGSGPSINAAMGPHDTRRSCALGSEARRLLDGAYQRLGLSARALDRIMKVALTIADLEGREEIRSEDVAEAIHYRALDRRIDAVS